jgi:histidyl-tRNA synthetase
MSQITKIKGFADILSPDVEAMLKLERTAREVFGRYGYHELRIPILERTELFCRSIGDETDVVQKEMYTFPDRKGRSLTLRPEATAGVMRAYIENGLHAKGKEAKLYTFGPMFRYERPQKGRMRQFHQINAECVGPAEPLADAETILMLWTFLTEVGLQELSLELNSLGCRECRPLYNQALADFLAGLDKEKLCEDCRRRMSTNPLRVLDCKVPTCKELTVSAPSIAEHNCPECETHFAEVKRVLDACAIPYVLNPRLVRGLDYYVRTTFELVSGKIGAQSSVAGGGRYDGLIKQLGGPDVPGVGFACGVERLLLLMAPPEPAAPDFYLATLDQAGLADGLILAQQLRKAGLAGEAAFSAKSLKSQMREANKRNAKVCLVRGADEIASKQVQAKRMRSGEQQPFSCNDLQSLIDYINAPE